MKFTQEEIIAAYYYVSIVEKHQVNLENVQTPYQRKFY